MPPQSSGQPQRPPPTPNALHTRSTPNLPTISSYETGNDSNTSSATASITLATLQTERGSPEIITSPSEPASIEDCSLESSNELPLLSDDEDDSEDEEDEDEGQEEDGQLGHLPPRTLNKQHSKSYTYLSPSTFAPPFYGRPPIPLPPSPSLTSLLRPTFTQSRPTTPDPSSDEGTPNTRGDATGSQTPNSAAASTLTSTFRTAKPIPRASPKVPTYEYYGFTLYLTSSLTFVAILLWSFLPSPFLEQLGIYYYPNRWWALAIPAWTVMLVIYIYVALASYNTGYLTLPMNSVECMVDEAANVAIIDAQGNLIREDKPSWHVTSPQDSKRAEKGKKGGKGKGGGRSRQGSLNKTRPYAGDGELDWRSMWTEGTDAVMDIPIGGVCEILYGRGNDEVDVSGNAHDR